MYLNLNAEMARKKVTQLEIASKLNINSSTMSDKLNGKADFKLKECKDIKKIFFPNCSLDYLFNVEKESS